MQIEMEILELRTRHVFATARVSAPPPVRCNVFVRLIDRDGVEGWGEAAPQPYYGETADTVAAVLPRYAAVLERFDSEPWRLEEIERALEKEIGRNAAARVALSAALHDLAGKRAGLPVWKMWGVPSDIPVSSFTIGLDEPERMRARVREAASYPVLKVKVGTERDEEVLRLIRDEAPDKVVRVDANTGWTRKQALASLPMLEEYDVELLEEPLKADDHEGLRMLRERSRIPIVADESCRIAADIPRLAGCVDGINIKLTKCGSLREAVRMVHVARAHRMQIMLGCMVESTLGIAAAAQLAPLVDWVDLDGAALIANDPFRGPALKSDGTMELNDAPGLGVTRSEQA